MKKTALLITCVLLAVQVFAQTKEDRKVSDFTELEVSADIKVILTMSETESLTLEADAEVMPKIKSEVKKGELHLYMEGRINSKRPVIAYLNAKQLNSISAIGASSVKVTNQLKGKEIDLKATGASAIFAEVETGHLEVDISGAGFMEIKGMTESPDFRTIIFDFW